MLKDLSERSKRLSTKVCSTLFCCQGSFAYLPNISRHYFHSSIGLHICLYITSLTKYHYLCQGFVANLLKSAFPHLTDNQIKITVTGLFNLNQDIPGFKDHLRDFLVQIREFTGEDDSDLFLEEREQALKSAQDEKRRVQMTVPGILNPHEIGEDMQD